MNLPKMTDEQALALLLQSDLWDMHKHVGWNGDTSGGSVVSIGDIEWKRY